MVAVGKNKRAKRMSGSVSDHEPVSATASAAVAADLWLSPATECFAPSAWPLPRDGPGPTARRPCAGESHFPVAVTAGEGSRKGAKNDERRVLRPEVCVVGQAAHEGTRKHKLSSLR